MKKILTTLLILLGLGLPSIAFAQLTVAAGGTGLSTVPTGLCLMGGSTPGLRLIAGACGAGTFPFTSVAGGNATSSVIYHYGGLTSLGSTTIQFASSTSMTVSQATYLATGAGFVGIGTTSPNFLLSVGHLAGTTDGNGYFSGTVYANNFVDLSVSGSTCIGETNGLIGTSNCVSSLASAGGSLTISSPTGAVDASINSSSLTTNALTAWSGSKLVATGTPTLTVGNLVATTTATSTFGGGLSITTGCFAIGSTCVGGGSSATGKTINNFVATTSNNFLRAAGGTPYPMSTTTPINAGESLMVWGSCTWQSSGQDIAMYLTVGNPGGGTTTIGYAVNSNTTIQYFPTFLGGVYNSTTTGTARIEIDVDNGASARTFANCTTPTIMYQRFTN